MEVIKTLEALWRINATVSLLWTYDSRETNTTTTTTTTPTAAKHSGTRETKCALNPHRYKKSSLSRHSYVS